MARKYEMKRRAERMLETHQRIIEAAVELHQSVGLARTTVSAIASEPAFPVPTASLDVEQSRWSVKPQVSVCVR